jgi:hypothetical protein
LTSAMLPFFLNLTIFLSFTDHITSLLSLEFTFARPSLSWFLFIHVLVQISWLFKGTVLITLFNIIHLPGTLNRCPALFSS